MFLGLGNCFDFYVQRVLYGEQKPRRDHLLPKAEAWQESQLSIEVKPSALEAFKV